MDCQVFKSHRGGTIAALSLMAVISMATGASADVVVQWDFNDASLDPSAGTMASTASIGTVGGVIGSTFASGAGSSDPFQPGLGWQTSGYPSQGAGHAIGGIQFSVSTIGYEGIQVSFDLRPSNTASGWALLLYSLDGGLSYQEGSTFEATSGSTWFTGWGDDLSSIAAASDNPELVFRIVSIYGPNGFGFEAAQPGSSYSGGTWRFDMITVTGTPSVIPAPAVAAMLGLLGLAPGASGTRRRRRN